MPSPFDAIIQVIVTIGAVFGLVEWRIRALRTCFERHIKRVEPIIERFWQLEQKYTDSEDIRKTKESKL